MKQLTVKEQKFAALCVELGNQSEAYRQAYNPKDKSADWIKVRASELANKSNIKVTIENIRKELKANQTIDIQWALEQHLEVIEWYKELKALAKRTDLSKAEISRVYMLKDLIKGSDYRGSVDAVIKMYGIGAADRSEVKQTIEIIEKSRDE